ncbi:MAG: bifunctional 4-hydroxy-2-oxoglutarate aldolase/2-dehydro-3-deoxy-phosphogluconate aldolase [Verrucomicrobiota bacterium]|jgi:2-dehydro-3-deoxyphosphogluconate aldolase/(4S)-4-hydroxy-2-oxoglutarate aldolase|nr:bifunctional 4-hydroxy-2-oxoglutarate aldolase/2-dehydro-3-deoxy-phosphogluconate aldolase [Verrucomicrobiota bacterium]MEC8905793.1 bifunctional 4-hydroxy-2-oxoglutarate aldolase/2-dehydro-3-deoxy-phosphogluconate aldolase [Verrucomicrobiota bacterium]MEC9327483.1 bifunctional 4-hydroxy-2-oxoglutarate aldolase/2-dehydro-3-deoxy-phosphogluconate aldolase [Verrucomicrobiota bacterium]MED6299427.1 bifunctional 4-hydroxy-2-oxoglutarate aldolase/2-dehydro-3-deoxy-phosphogluconate aldolase [Verruc
MKVADPVATRLTAKGVVAVLMIDRVDDAVPVAEALLRGGVDAMELTLRTEAALPALELITGSVPEMLAGIGTILKPDQVIQARDSGAAFGVSPGTNVEVIEAAHAAGLPFAPGIMTPSDIERALPFGCEILKFFPAGSSGGIKHLKNIAAPYAHLGLKYVPLGGVNEDNMTDYLKEDIIAAVGGSWIAQKDLIASGQWDQITSNASSAVQVYENLVK